MFPQDFRRDSSNNVSRDPFSRRTKAFWRNLKATLESFRNFSPLSSSVLFPLFSNDRSITLCIIFLLKVKVSKSDEA